MLYDAIDSSDGYYVNNIDPKYRSRMNIPFRVCDNKDLEAKFVAEAQEAGFISLKGHASVGGIRASIYNAMPIEGVASFVKFMQQFKKDNMPAKL